MKQLKKLATVSALLLAGVTAAYANAPTTTYVPMDPGSPGDFVNTWSFDDNNNTTTHHRGGTFDDFYIFNVPDEEDVSFSAQSVGSGVKFEGFALYSWADGTLLDVEDFGSASQLSLTGGEWDLTSGTYALELAGAFSKAGGTYNGFVEGSAPVPEPTNWALMLAGLGAVGTLARRRAKKA